ncbi:MAG: DNA gyrase subunit A [Elusimicrobia bacterium]|nr:DNA gyrase subunit A [Elusimicrobiota bacterium]
MADDKDKSKTNPPEPPSSLGSAKGQPQLPLGRFETRAIEEEMKSSYIDYAMSVIVGRALPDARDGLKPVHRRILYAMDEMGLAYNKPFKKAARVVGDCLGKYHPHGDLSVYDALVRMAQDFSMLIPLVEGQGNMGSVDGDPPAAMRYTEVRLARISQEMLADLEKKTVDFVPNYDGSLTEPRVMPAKLPNLLLNGSSGIAVGMATNIPPHNLGELCDAAAAYIDNPEITTDELMDHIKGPDFPTGGFIMGSAGIKEYFTTGRGSVVLRAKTEFEDIKGGRTAIIVKEIPYQVNKAALLENIAALVRDKKINDISDLRDESDRDGIRVVIEVKRDGNPHVLLNQLFRQTQFEVSFGVIMLALVDDRPKVLSLKESLAAYAEHRREIIRRRTIFDLAKADERAHIVEGLRIAIDAINKVIKIIRESKDTETARMTLVKELGLSIRQATAILEMRLAQLTGLERKKLEEEYRELIKTIERLRGILQSSRKILEIVKEELAKLKKDYAKERRSEIVEEIKETNIEDLIKKEEVVVTISSQGYIKRLPVDVYRAQARGGKGITAMDNREGEDFVEEVIITDTHATMLFFTNRGKVYQARVYEIPESSRVSRGKPIIQFIGIVSNKEEKVTGTVTIRNFAEKGVGQLILATKKGVVKRCDLKLFQHIRKTGVAAVSLREGDVLMGALKTDGSKEVLLATKHGKLIRFAETDVRSMGRGACGVRGIRLEKTDEVVGLEVANKDDKRTLLSVCENGYGKRTDLDEYRDQSRGGSGIFTIKASERNGSVVGIKLVDNDSDLMILTEKGMGVRLRTKDIKVISRNTQGVRLVRLEGSDKVACVEPIAAGNSN